MKKMDEENLREILKLRYGNEFPAADYAVAAFLADGDTGPLLRLLESDQPIPPKVRETLIAMLKDGSRKELRTAARFKIVWRDGKRGAPKNRLEKTGGKALDGWYVFQLIEEYGPGGYDAAISQAASKLGIKESEAREAYSFFKKFLEKNNSK